MLNPHQLPLLLAIGLIVLAGALVVDHDPQLPRLAEPRVSAERAATAVVPDIDPIRPFAHYYGDEDDDWRHLNPFVPFPARQVERRIIQEREAAPANPTIVESDLPHPPDPVDQVIEAPIPPPDIPALADSQPAMPQVAGYIAGPADRQLRVRFRDGGQVHVMRIGDQQAGWTLVALVDGQAHFTDREGFEQRVPIGEREGRATRISSAGGGGSGDTHNVPPRAMGDTGGGAMNTGGGGGSDGDFDLEAVITAIERTPFGRALEERDPAWRDKLRANPSRARRIAQQFGLLE